MYRQFCAHEAHLNKNRLFKKSLQRSIFEVVLEAVPQNLCKRHVMCKTDSFFHLSWAVDYVDHAVTCEFK